MHPMSISAEQQSIQNQLANKQGNLLLIEEQISKFVQDTDVPLQLLKEQREHQVEIAALQQKLVALNSPAAHPTPPGSAKAYWYRWLSAAIITLLLAVGAAWPWLTAGMRTTFTTPTLRSTSAIWDGSWQTRCDVLVCNTLTLTQNGDRVSGVFANGMGELNGTAKGNLLTGQITLPGDVSETFDFWQDTSTRQLTGNWGKLYAWCGVPVGSDTLPSTEHCGVARWYGTEWQTSSGNLRILQQDAVAVTGIITLDNTAGQVVGTIENNRFQGNWHANDQSVTGKLELFLLPNSNGRQFNGNLAKDQPLCGVQSGSGLQLPTPCLNPGDLVVTIPDIFIEASLLARNPDIFQRIYLATATPTSNPLLDFRLHATAIFRIDP